MYLAFTYSKTPTIEDKKSNIRIAVSNITVQMIGFVVTFVFYQNVERNNKCWSNGVDWSSTEKSGFVDIAFQFAALIIGLGLLFISGFLECIFLFGAAFFESWVMYTICRIWDAVNFLGLAIMRNYPQLLPSRGAFLLTIGILGLLVLVVLIVMTFAMLVCKKKVPPKGKRTSKK